MSMCTVFSCVLGRGCFLWPVLSLGKTLLAFALLHSVLQGQICLLLQVFFDFLLLHFSPLQWKVCIKSLLTSDVSVRVWSEQSEWPGIIIMWIRPYAVAGAGGEDHGRLLHLVQCCCSLTWVMPLPPALSQTPHILAGLAAFASWSVFVWSVLSWLPT